MNKKKWLLFSVVGSALLLIPRRSSRNSMAHVPHAPMSKQNSQNTKNTQSSHDKTTDSDQ